MRGWIHRRRAMRRKAEVVVDKIMTGEIKFDFKTGKLIGDSAPLLPEGEEYKVITQVSGRLLSLPYKGCRERRHDHHHGRRLHQQHHDRASSSCLLGPRPYYHPRTSPLSDPTSPQSPPSNPPNPLYPRRSTSGCWRTRSGSRPWSSRSWADRSGRARSSRASGAVPMGDQHTPADRST
jgi:hypothetical protein